MAADSRKLFRRNFVIVTVLHAVVIAAIGWIQFRPPPPEPIKTINLINPGSLVKGTPGPSESPAVKKFETPPPAAAAAAPPPKSPQLPQTPPPVKTQPPPAAAEAPQPPSEIPLAKTKTSTTPPAAPAEKPKKVAVKVNKNVVTRQNASTASSSSSASSPAAHTASPDAGSVANRLGTALRNSGVATATATGPDGAANGTRSDFSDYYTLIRNQMYEKWDQPIQFAGKKLRTQIQIIVEKSGLLSTVSLLTTSGNSVFDESALTAARSVKQIREPLPDGMNGTITIDFKLTE
jgi:TonB family protein